MLPNFMVIGTQRGGSSSLYKYLGAHPRVSPSLRKEVEFFNRWYHLGVDWYRAHFPLSLRSSLGQAAFRGPLQSFEATPQYLFDERAPARAARVVPDAKLIVMLRDPVERAFSHYKHSLRLGLEDRSFSRAIAEEPEEMNAERQRQEADPAYFSVRMARHSYVLRGRYAEQLERWFRFFPRDQFLVVSSEDFYGDTSAVFSQIVGFLDLPEWQPRTFHNFSFVPPQPTNHMPEQIRTLLREEFADPNQRLYELIGRDFGWQ